MTKVSVFNEHQGHEVHVIPPTGPHPEMEVGIAVVGNGTALRVYVSRAEAKAIAREILRVAKS